MLIKGGPLFFTMHSLKHLCFHLLQPTAKVQIRTAWIVKPIKRTNVRTARKGFTSTPSARNVQVRNCPKTHSSNFVLLQFFSLFVFLHRPKNTWNHNTNKIFFLQLETSLPSYFIEYQIHDRFITLMGITIHGKMEILFSKNLFIENYYCCS